MKTFKRLLCLALCVLLTGCSAKPAASPVAQLPSAPAGPDAPLGDAGLSQETIVPLYLPSHDGQSLLAFYETMLLPRDQHPAQIVLQALMAHPGNSRVRPLAGDVTLSLYGANPVEISGSVCTVNLSANALALSMQELYTTALAISTTLCELDGIDYVNLLIAGTPVAMDVGGNLPLGLLTSTTTQELPVLWEQMIARRTPVGELPAHTPLTATAALYVPLADGTGVAAEPRRIAFSGQHPQQQVTALLTALSAGADTLTVAADMPDLNSLLLFLPEITELDSGGRRVTLHFTANVKERIAASCDPSCMFAAITLTLTSFVPSVQQVCILVGDGALTSLYSPTLGSQLFPGALMNRQHFAHALMALATVYVPQGHQLTARKLSMPYRSASSPRAVLLTLDALPEGLTDADILGLAIKDDTLLVNFSTRYADVLRQSPQQQRLAAYAMVNTLCEMLGTRRVRFYFGSETVETLGSNLAWDGEFLCNPALITH